MSGAVIQLPGLDLAGFAGPLAVYLFAMLRVGAFLMAAPVFGGRYVPVTVRVIAAACLALPVADAPGLPTPGQIAQMSVVPLVLQEIALGIVAGLVPTILFAAAGMAGDRIANAAGLGFAAQLDPTAGGQSPVVAHLFGLMQIFVFIGTDAHLVALRIVLESYDAFPPGRVPDLGTLVGAGLAAGTQMFALAAVLMLPVVTGLLLLNLAVGVVSRSAPQMNLFSVGFPLALLGAFALLWLTLPGTLDGMADITRAASLHLASLIGAGP
jgi:flagellar biosynthetic protein FliR